MDEVQLCLDRESAQALYDLLYSAGDCIAAGAPLPPFPPELNQRLTVIFNDLERQLGIECMASAMQRAFDTNNRATGDTYGCPDDADGQRVRFRGTC